VKAAALQRVEAARYLHMVYVEVRPPPAVDERVQTATPAATSIAASATPTAGPVTGGDVGRAHSGHDSSLVEALSTAASAAAPDRTVIVLYTNGGFSRLAANALCSLHRYSLLPRSLVLAHDPATCAALRPELRTAGAPGALGHMPCVALRRWPTAPGSTVSGGAARWGTTAYKLVVASKLRAFTAVVEAGYAMLAIDADIVFAADPRPLLARLAAAEHQVAFMHDGLGGGVSRTPGCASDVEPAAASGPVTANTGFFYARPQEPVRRLLRRAIRIIEAGRTPLDGTDQGALNLALEETPAAELRRHLLTCREAQNGWHYFGPAGAPNRRHAIVANANWIVGEPSKRECLRASGLWFVAGGNSPDGLRCVESSPRNFTSAVVRTGEVRSCARVADGLY
jgi:hypothetical protein